MALQAPIDYTFQAIDPFTAGMAGFQMGMNRQAGQQAMEGEAQRQGLVDVQAQRDTVLFDQAQQDRQAAIEAAAVAAEKEQAMTQAMVADQNALYERMAAGDATLQDLTGFVLKYPSLSDELKAPFESYTKERKSADIFELGRAGSALKAGRPDIAVKLLEDRAVAMENAGDTEGAEQARAMIAQVEMDPAAALTLVGITMKSLGADDELTAVFGSGSGRKVQSTIDLGGGLTAAVYADGSKEVKDATGQILEGQAAIDAIKAAEDRGVELKRLGAAGTAEGKLSVEEESAGAIQAEKRAASVNQEAVKEATSALGVIRSTLGNYDAALAALDQGAETGVIAAKMPTLTAAGALLENAKLRAGLDVIASVTFGALSEGERNAAMQTALPMNLDGPELRQWILNRQAVERKIAEIQAEAIRHFSQRGKSQRQLQSEWVDKYSSMVPDLQLPAADTGGGEAPAQFEIGDRAENPETGEELEFDGTQWVPVK